MAFFTSRYFGLRDYAKLYGAGLFGVHGVVQSLFNPHPLPRRGCKQHPHQASAVRGSRRAELVIDITGVGRVDALRVKVRDEGLVRNKAVHIALGVRADGTKEILGLWLEQNEGAKFWLRVMNELKNHGVEDVLIAVVDGLKGFPEAITAVFPHATVQTCIVHLLRHSLDFVSWKDRKPVAAALKEIWSRRR